LYQHKEMEKQAGELALATIELAAEIIPRNHFGCMGVQSYSTGLSSQAFDV
jgi:hypothetical protein